MDTIPLNQKVLSQFPTYIYLDNIKQEILVLAL